MNARLLDDVLRLDAKDRLELMEKLWDSLAPNDLQVTAEEAGHLEQRIADMEANPQSQSSWDDVKSRLANRRS